MRHTTLVLVFSLLAGCFPNSARHRTIAKLSEGGAIVAGIALLQIAGTGADCNAGPAMQAQDDKCRGNAALIGNVGLGLILTGLVGFAITVVTTPDEAPPPPAAITGTDAGDDDAGAAKPTLPTRTATKPRP